MVFCNIVSVSNASVVMLVTILILIDGFLQFKDGELTKAENKGHNPYFNRWFSAISHPPITFDNIR